MLHKFKKTYKFNDKEYIELDIPIEEATTLDYEKAERQFRTLNPGYIGALEMDTGFLKQVLVNSCKLPAEFFDALPINEFMAVKLKVQSFLLSSAAE